MNDIEIIEAIREGMKTAMWECTDTEGLSRATNAMLAAGAPVKALSHDHDTRVTTWTLNDGRKVRTSVVPGTICDLLLESDDIWIDP